MDGDDAGPSRLLAGGLRPAALAALQRRLELLVVTPYAMLPPVMAIYGLDEYQADPRTGTALRLLVTVPVAAALLIAVPYGGLVLALGKFAYDYRARAGELEQIDWQSARWRPAADALRRTGLDPDSVPAFRLFSSQANLAAIHLPRSYPGVWQRMSDWSVDHRRSLLAAGGVIGASAFAVSSAWPRWTAWTHAPVTTAIVAVADAVLLPACVVLGVRMYRLNIRSACLGVTIPTQWRVQLRDSPETAVPLFAHEWSHVRHRDALRRRILDAYGSYQWFIIFLTAGGAFGAFNNVTSALVFPGLGIVVLATLVMRRVRRSIPLVQEMRADADACRGAPDGLRAALAGLPKAHDTPWLRARLAVLDDRESARLLHRLRRWLWAGWLGCVIPVAGCTTVAIWVRL